MKDKTTIISEIEIMPIKPQNGLIAFASFTLFEIIHCSSVAIFTKPNGGYRLSYPTKKIGNQNIFIFYPIDKVLGNEIEERVIARYEDLTKDYIKDGRYYCSRV